MIALRLYLLLGLLSHKAVWEVLKRQHTTISAESRAPKPFRVLVFKVIKVSILIAILLQTVWGDVLPIATDALLLRAAGTLIYTVGLALALLARIQLGQNWLDIETAAVKDRQQVVSSGVYRYVRHPIYGGDLLLLLGLELALNSWLVIFVPLLAFAVIRQALQEERMLLQRLPGYRAYYQTTKRFIPFCV
jgi:protein-S-isoprenylcysteine O-methyltransferase Ste14